MSKSPSIIEQFNRVMSVLKSYVKIYFGIRIENYLHFLTNNYCNSFELVRLGLLIKKH